MLFIIRRLLYRFRVFRSLVKENRFFLSNSHSKDVIAGVLPPNYCLQRQRIIAFFHVQGIYLHFLLESPISRGENNMDKPWPRSD